MKVGVLGAGLLGFAMAERLLNQDYEVTVYNRTLDKAKPLEDLGATVVTQPRDAINDVQCVLLILSDSAAVRNVLFEKEITDFAQQTFIQMGTIRSDESQKFRDDVVMRNGLYCECPVLGSRTEAKEGRLILMFGGAREEFEKWRGLFSVFGPQPVYVGDVGSAAVFKLALNQLIASHMCAFSLSLGLIQQQGIDEGLFMDVLQRSALHAPMFDKKLPKMLKRDFSNPNFSARHLLKDVDLIFYEAQRMKLQTAVLEGVQKTLQKTIQMGYGEEDYSSLFCAVGPHSEA